MKYDILTEHLTMFWFPMIINDYIIIRVHSAFSLVASCVLLKSGPPRELAGPGAKFYSGPL